MRLIGFHERTARTVTIVDELDLLPLRLRGVGPGFVQISFDFAVVEFLRIHLLRAGLLLELAIEIGFNFRKARAHADKLGVLVAIFEIVRAAGEQNFAIFLCGAAR